MGFLKKLFGDYSAKEVKRVLPLRDKVLALEETYAAKTDEELQAVTPALRERLANGETLDDILPDAFAACREASWRVLGMKHFPVQVVGGIILHQGRIAEMKPVRAKRSSLPCPHTSMPYPARGCMSSRSMITSPGVTRSGWARFTASWG